MKKVLLLSVLLLAMVFPTSLVHAKDFNTIIGNIDAPPVIKNLTDKGGASGLSLVLSNFVQLIFMISALAAVFMFLLGAFQWITSGGEKENVAKARSRITNAIIGLVLLALAFFILSILGKILHFSFFGTSPSPVVTDTCSPGTYPLISGHGCLNESGVGIAYCFSGYTPSSDNTDCI